MMWNAIIPSKISIFGWKLYFGTVPIDSVVKGYGIPIVLKCYSCKHSHKIESVDHLFAEGELGSNVWGYFATFLHFLLCCKFHRSTSYQDGGWHQGEKKIKKPFLHPSLPCLLYILTRNDHYHNEK